VTSSADPVGALPDVIVGVGASAGGVEALSAFVAGLPEDLPAAVVVVLHISPTGRSVLADILARRTVLPVISVEREQPLVGGVVYVAAPNRHLVVRDGQLAPIPGPRENGHRPAIDPLLRSIAAGAGRRSVGVVLSGTRDDGSAGLGRIKAVGGTALVQDPEEALYAGMPQSAIASVAVDAVLPVAALAARVAAIARDEVPPPPPPEEAALRSPDDSPTRFTCPDCGGVLHTHDEGGVGQYLCSVGHAYSPDSLDVEHARSLERTLWSAARIVDDRAALMRDMARRAEAHGHVRSRSRYLARAEELATDAAALREFASRTPERAMPAGDEAAA